MSRIARAAALVWARCYSVLLFGCLWEAVTRAGLVRPVFLPPLSTIGATLWGLMLSGEAEMELGTSLLRAAAGMAAAIILGLVAGLLMSRSRLVAWLLAPFVAAGFPAPKIAFIPIFTLWFGIDDVSKIVLVAFTCVFVVVIATVAAAAAVPGRLVWSAQALGTPPGRMVWRVVLPACLPQLYTGFRVCVPVALITAFTAEMISGGGGAGTALMYAQRFFDTPEVYAYIILMLATGFLIDLGLVSLQRRLFPWDTEASL